MHGSLATPATGAGGSEFLDADVGRAPSPHRYDCSVTDDPYATAGELGLMVGFPPPVSKRVDRSNAIMTPPYNRWSYQNMRTIYPSAPIRNADTVQRICIEIDPGITELTVARPDGTDVDFSTFLRETYTDSFLVVTPEQLVCEQYFNGMHAAQPHQMMSVTKSFVGLFALIAVAEGRVDEGQPIADILPELSAASAFSGATFGHVLDMVNSMDFGEAYADPTSGIVRYSRILGLLPASADQSMTDGLYGFLATLDDDPAHGHGEIFRYQTPKTDVVNWATNRISGKSFQAQMSDLLWSRLGTEAETYVLLDPQGTPVAGGGLNAGPRDLARFAMMLLNGGRIGADQIVAPAIIDRLQQGGSREAFARGPEAVGPMAGGDWSYRAQWWIRHSPGREAFTAIGIHGQWIYVDYRRQIAIVKQSSQPISSDPDTDQFTLNAFDSVVDHLTAKSSIA